MLHDPPQCPESSRCRGACPGAACAGCSPAGKPAEISGILNIDKPEGWTSHDVVARVRRLTGQKRAGHAGTLDPFATGVLLVCLGQATRVSEYLMDAHKLYRARIRFGAATDTFDVTGQITTETGVIPGRAEIEALLPRFIGQIQQVPPAYSALKIEGQPAYRRARRGEAVELAPRTVEVYEIRLLAWEPPDLELDILCGKGTYIRSLAHDLGLAAGSAAHLVALQRRAVGDLTVEEAVSPAELEAQVTAGSWQDLLYPLDEALLQYPALIAPAEDVNRLCHGQPIASGTVVEGALRRVYGPDGKFVALVQGDQQAGVWRPNKVFA